MGAWSWLWSCCCGGGPPPPGCHRCWTTGIYGITYYETIQPDSIDQKPYDYGIAFCNFNSARDDDFEVYVNGVGITRLPEIGTNSCGSRWLVSNPDIFAWMQLPQSAFACGGESISLMPAGSTCCLPFIPGTTGFPQTLITALPTDPFVAPDFDVFMQNVQNNGGGNFGSMSIFRFSNVTAAVAAYHGGEDLQDPSNRVCVHTWQNFYAATGGQDINLLFPGAQVIQP